MIGLLIKDIIQLKHNLKAYAFLIVFYIGFGIINESASFSLGIFAILPYFMLISTITYDDMANFNKYALTMPVTRKDLALSKYVLSFSTTTISFILALVGTFLIGNLDMEAILYIASAHFSVLMVSSVFLPFVFKYGMDKARYAMILVFFVPTIAATMLPRIFPDFSLEWFVGVFLFENMLLILILGLALVVFSYFASVTVLKAKEFN